MELLISAVKNLLAGIIRKQPIHVNS